MIEVTIDIIFSFRFKSHLFMQDDRKSWDVKWNLLNEQIWLVVKIIEKKITLLFLMVSFPNQTLFFCWIQKQSDFNSANQVARHLIFSLIQDFPDIESIILLQ